MDERLEKINLYFDDMPETDEEMDLLYSDLEDNVERLMQIHNDSYNGVDELPELDIRDFFDGDNDDVKPVPGGPGTEETTAENAIGPETTPAQSWPLTHHGEAL
ncbi:hypothetical protein V5799_030642 [Amblyomma americanum]|uniref:Uncharacterized protein n=1 Tax=Amblyomma americanum TaxID=6943 RepID=A0AAQ4EMH8_AMBAM